MGTALLDEHRLTEKEKDLLEVMVNPEYHDLNVKDLCEIAEVSRPTYYSAIKKKYFVAEYKRRSAELVDHEIGEVVKALLREAKKGSAKHIQMALEMAGLYSKDINVNKRSVNLSLNGKDLQLMDEEELLEIANEYGINVDEVVDDNVQ